MADKLQYKVTSTIGSGERYVGNLDSGASEELLMAVFSHIGPVRSCKLIHEDTRTIRDLHHLPNPLLLLLLLLPPPPPPPPPTNTKTTTTTTTTTTTNISTHPPITTNHLHQPPPLASA
ncbi:uncharacterized protein LOC135195290 [Macrobrachium nipponense]|uniref:uncharacterized protein LOC135195290 n=1 Tax=Macrobrachium nipponense TaxID=159736 RepID=UPI0030C83A5E